MLPGAARGGLVGSRLDRCGNMGGRGKKGRVVGRPKKKAKAVKQRATKATSSKTSCGICENTTRELFFCVGGVMDTHHLEIGVFLFLGPSPIGAIFYAICGYWIRSCHMKSIWTKSMSYRKRSLFPHPSEWGC